MLGSHKVCSINLLHRNPKEERDKSKQPDSEPSLSAVRKMEFDSISFVER
jgi:hypothetical protein